MKKVIIAVTVAALAVTTLTTLSGCNEKIQDTGNKIVSSAKDYVTSEAGVDPDIGKIGDNAVSYLNEELGLNNSANKLLEGTWLSEKKATDDWQWAFDGVNKCKLASVQYNSASDGTYSVNESKGTVDICLNSWDKTITFTYKLSKTLSDEYLKLSSDTQGYSLIKQKAE